MDSNLIEIHFSQGVIASWSPSRDFYPQNIVLKIVGGSLHSKKKLEPELSDRLLFNNKNIPVTHKSLEGSKQFVFGLFCCRVEGRLCKVSHDILGVDDNHE